MIRLYILWDLEFSFQLSFVLCSCSLFIRGLACSTVAFYVGLYSSHQKKNDAQYGFCKHVKNLCFQNIGMTCFLCWKEHTYDKSKGFYWISLAKVKDFFRCSQCYSFIDAYCFYSIAPLTPETFYREKKAQQLSFPRGFKFRYELCYYRKWRHGQYLFTQEAQQAEQFW